MPKGKMKGFRASEAAARVGSGCGNAFKGTDHLGCLCVMILGAESIAVTTGMVKWSKLLYSGHTQLEVWVRILFQANIFGWYAAHQVSTLCLCSEGH